MTNRLANLALIAAAVVAVGFTPPIGSDKGSVIGGTTPPPGAPSLLGEEPIYYLKR